MKTLKIEVKQNEDAKTYRIVSGSTVLYPCYTLAMAERVQASLIKAHNECERVKPSKNPRFAIAA